jgi:hypothetical protein
LAGLGGGAETPRKHEQERDEEEGDAGQANRPVQPVRVGVFEEIDTPVNNAVDTCGSTRKAGAALLSHKPTWGRMRGVVALVVAAGLVLVLPGLVPGLPVSGPSHLGTIVPVDVDAVAQVAHEGRLLLALPGLVLDARLEPNPIALGAVYGVGGDVGGVVDAVTTFKGATAEGWPVRLGLTPAGVFLVVFAPDPVSMEPEWLRNPSAAPSLHRVYRWSEAPVRIEDQELAPPVAPVPRRSPRDASHHEGEPVNREATFLLENDFRFHLQFTAAGACPTCWVTVQQAVLNVAEQLFESSNLGITFRITSQWTCPTETACPYGPSLGSNAGSWLLAFRNRWQDITTEPPHELGHMFVSTNLEGSGVAYQASLSTEWGYALSEVAALLGGAGVLQYGVVAHEIGHNFDGRHEEAAPVPQQIGAAGGSDSVVHTIMHCCNTFVFQFSDGTWHPEFNNRARIRAMALERLPD